MNAAVDDNEIKTKTADYLGVPTDRVLISAVDKHLLATTYRAQYVDKRFSCSIYYGQVDCRPLLALDPSDQKSSAAAPTTQQPEMTYVQAQTRLNQLGFSVGAADGVFGKKSVHQLELFQKSRGLPESGELDPATIEALRA